MAYTSGDTILDDEYNTFATGNAAGTGDNNTANINTIWGTGTSDKGYGQSTTISAVSAGSTITATQWATLFTRLTSIANHQGTTITALTNPSTGDTIDVKANFSANLSTCFTNRRNATAEGSDITSGGSVDLTGTWTSQSQVEYTITFSSNNTARYFFNGGGIIKITSSRSGGTTSDKNTEWTDLCGAIGTIAITGGGGDAVINGTTYSGTDRLSGSGATPTINDNYGFVDSTSTYVEVFKQYADTSPYTSNYIAVELKDDGAGVINVRVTYKDDATDTGDPTYVLPGTDPAGLDEVDGTLNTTLVLTQPSTTYISNTWGTPTISSSTSQS